MIFHSLFKPKSMAVIGVSRDNEQHPANVIFNKNRLRYPVQVYPVNPKGGIFQGQTVYQSIKDIPEAIDLAVIAVRAEYVPDVLAECISSGTGGATIISGGFAESGRKDLQEKLVKMAMEADFPFIGPNCLGFYRPSQVDTFFIPSERMIRPYSGNVAMVSQSGGILVDQVVKFSQQGVGLSLAVSIGNKALIQEVDLLNYLAQDKATSVIAFYVEGFGPNEGRDFVLEASKCPKPVIVLKAGKSSEGVSAVSSHTASMAGDYEVFSSAVRQHGLVEALNEFELISFCEALSCYPKNLQGNVGIITGSGGHGALAVDFLSQHGLSAPPLSESNQKEIRKSLSKSVSPIASVVNPVDLTGSAVDEDFVAATHYLSQLETIDSIIILLLPYSPGITSDLGARLSDISRNANKPVVAYLPHVERYKMMIEGFELNRVPVSPSVQGAVMMVKALKEGS